MDSRNSSAAMEALEVRQLLAWSSYAQLVDQDVAASRYKNITGAGVTVAVIDTGIDYTHSALGGGLGEEFKVIGGYDFVDNDMDPMDESGHGTNVAGVIAADPYTVGGITHQGVAPDAKLVALRVGSEDNIPNSNIEDALQWVIDNHEDFSISVVNLSIGSGNHIDSNTDSVLANELAQLRRLGIFVVAASGNSNDQSSGPISQDGIAYPAADPNVFAVAAVNANDIISTWSQRGDELDMVAPGVDTVMPKLDGGFLTEDGTSFASPHVAGAAALIKQLTPSARAGDIGSILMTSGVNNRDGSGESGNTTTLQFSRLDIDNALALASQRAGKSSAFNFGSVFDTALDSQGVLHAVYYNATKDNIIYATRSTSGKWSVGKTIDARGDVGSQLSIAVDTTGKLGVAYFDNTKTAVKYASFNGVRWSTRMIDSSKHVGTSPSVAFDIDGNAYIAYYRKTSGDLKLAQLDRDAGTWATAIIDGSGANVGAVTSIDVGEAPVGGSGVFTVYDTTVAIAYSDSTNGNLKYARLDLDRANAAWFVAVVDDLNGVSSIDLNLHAGPTDGTLQAQIAYLDASTSTVKYAFRDGTFEVATIGASVAASPVQLFFDSDDLPSVAYLNRNGRTLEVATRATNGRWNSFATATRSSRTAPGRTCSRESWCNRRREWVRSGPLSVWDKVRMRAGGKGIFGDRNAPMSKASTSAGPHPDPLTAGQGTRRRLPEPR
jgi:subtilisin family serine protease